MEFDEHKEKIRRLEEELKSERAILRRKFGPARKYAQQVTTEFRMRELIVEEYASFLQKYVVGEGE